MTTNTFYILEHANGYQFWGDNREYSGYGWHIYPPERAEKFKTYQQAKDFKEDKNFYTDRYKEEFANCKIKKLTIYVDFSDCEGENVSN